jgi:hypothetical protein
MTTHHPNPVFFEADDGSWWWYDENQPELTDDSGRTISSAYPTYGPFKLEATAKKHCVFFFNNLQDMYGDGIGGFV